jgi:hypothetical protein
LQHAPLAVDEGDGALAGARVAVTRIERDQTGLGPQLADVDRSFVLAADAQRS